MLGLTDDSYIIEDSELPDKLRHEYSGILNWMLDGLRQWKANGQSIKLPAGVVNATMQFREESDIIGKWMDESATLGHLATWESGCAYGSFKLWSEQAGIRPFTKNRFTRNLKERGISQQRCGGGRGQEYVGICRFA